ncbi:cyanoexosortase A [Spirulina subsalsa FACHB-351]|uniref:Cyanoexosortase A n=1 Tax=Spirulina subsalsa FACHB-351 TaxID=234711 RepID=A0ABT3L5M1_9CYAN|nr:cyanoexosortase A [Spirulina subsalsa]MCW6036794.1 cyanoexosortase A [Spirulina subsalsa FACHB-351]
MKLEQNSLLSYLYSPQYWLLGITTGLIAIYGQLVWLSDDANLISTVLLFFGVIGYLIYQKRQSLQLVSSPLATLFGMVLIGLFLLWTNLPANVSLNPRFLPVLPLFFGGGLMLIASGFKGLKQYIPELIILAVLSLPYLVLYYVINLSAITANFTAFLLWYSGFDVSHVGSFLILPDATVNVREGCSGAEGISHLFGLGVLFLIMFPQSHGKKAVLLVFSFVLGFFMNSLRVILMVMLVAGGDGEAFYYWHEGDGSLIFSLISVTFLAGFCFWLLQEPTSEKLDPPSLS